MKLSSSLISVLLLSLCLTESAVAEKPADAQLRLGDAGYFEDRGLNVLVFSNWYNGLFSDSKISGVEFIHHGERTVTNGDVRLQATPEQWDAIPEFVERKIDKERQRIEAVLKYAEYDFEYTVRVQPDKDGLILTVNLPRALPSSLVGKAGFNLEFLPAAYFEKTFLIDGRPGVLPLYPAGPKEVNGIQQPEALASGRRLVMAASDQLRRVSIESLDGEVSLFDGRSKAQNGWYVVRGMLPANQRGDVLRWRLTAGVIKDWLRAPVIGHSQLGYHPKQQKVAVVERDSNDTHLEVATLHKVNSEGQWHLVHKAKLKSWGRYTRYQYGHFDFSHVTDPGVYVLQYGRVKTAPFLIDKNVYKNAWHPTLDVYFPVQMDHMLVNEAYRVWHGASHLDDALQAPVDHTHFDLYAQGPTTATDYAPGEHIPGLNIGGWYDAGDYDIRTQTQYRTVLGLVDVWERFQPRRDTTRVDYDNKFVDIHVPDGKVDILQQIEHGTLALLAQHRALGRAIPGIIVPSLAQYTHLGDGLTMTDNLIYSKEMSAQQSDGFRSGKFDDRWAFTSPSSALNYGSIAALAAASRALSKYDSELSAECLSVAKKAWAEEQTHAPYVFRHGNTTGGPLEAEQLRAALELLITTGDKQYVKAILALSSEMESHFAMHASALVRATPHMDEAFEARLRVLAQSYVEQWSANTRKNPYGVEITEGGWAGNGTIIRTAIQHFYLHQQFPDLVSAEQVMSALNYLYGTHPDSDISFVSNVGTQSKRVAYGMNRADFSFISGGIVPGVLILKPDFPENKENWPFLWGENEYVINLGADYIFLVHAVDELLQ